VNRTDSGRTPIVYAADSYDFVVMSALYRRAVARKSPKGKSLRTEASIYIRRKFISNRFTAFASFFARLLDLPVDLSSICLVYPRVEKRERSNHSP